MIHTNKWKPNNKFKYFNLTPNKLPTTSHPTIYFLRSPHSAPFLRKTHTRTHNTQLKAKRCENGVLLFSRTSALRFRFHPLCMANVTKSTLTLFIWLMWLFIYFFWFGQICFCIFFCLYEILNAYFHAFLLRNFYVFLRSGCSVFVAEFLNFLFLIMNLKVLNLLFYWTDSVCAFGVSDIWNCYTVVLEVFVWFLNPRIYFPFFFCFFSWIFKYFVSIASRLVSVCLEFGLFLMLLIWSYCFRDAMHS